MEKINWGIIGCGDVTEIKSGPAFNKASNSSLVAVMRRDAEKARDYAMRHHVPRWYNDANQLIHDPEVNAIYIATPPDFHERYTLAAIQAGKPVYVEKPMALNYATACNMVYAASVNDVKLVVAHYRRAQPLFKKIKELIDSKVIGDIYLARLQLYKPSLSETDLSDNKNAWRVNPSVSGGGLFHDLAPHQLDLMCHFFGAVEKADGIAINQGGHYIADDMVAGNVLFKNGVVFNGAWCFNAPMDVDRCELIGSAGSINFSFFSGHTITLVQSGISSNIQFDPIQHVQQPMIEATVQYFLDNALNPCSAEEAAETMRLLELFTKK